MNLHYWKREEQENLGDYLSTVVVSFMMKQCGIENMTAKTRHLYAIGSILQAGMQNATVWGSGYINELTPRQSWIYNHLRKLDIRLVRGPETRRVILEGGGNCPETYGDPAILMPWIYTSPCAGKDRSYSVILHYEDMMSVENVISILGTDYQRVIDDIVRSKLIISSSLHGIILAEAYGVPAIFLSPPRIRTSSV